MNIEDYLDTVHRSFDSNVKESIQELKLELLKVASNKNVSQERIDAACTKLLHKIKPIVDKNLSKFSLYAVRNVFKESLDAMNAIEANNSVNNSLIAPSSSSSSSSNTADLDAEAAQLDQTLETLKRDYLKLHQDYSRIVAECQDMDALIKDMRETSFSVRLRIQEMDQQMEQQSLAESTTALGDIRARLQECCNEAEALIRKMNAAQNISEEAEEEESYFIETDEGPGANISTADANNITAASVNQSTTNNSNNINSYTVRAGPASAVLRVAQSLQPPGGRK